MTQKLMPTFLKNLSHHIGKSLSNSLIKKFFILFFLGYTACVQGSLQTTISISKTTDINIPTGSTPSIQKPITLNFEQEMDFSSAPQTLMQQDPNAKLSLLLTKLHIQTSGVRVYAIRNFNVNAKNTTDGSVITLFTQDDISSDTIEITRTVPVDISDFVNSDGKLNLNFHFEGDVGGKDSSIKINSDAELEAKLDFQKSLIPN